MNQRELWSHMMEMKARNTARMAGIRKDAFEYPKILATLSEDVTFRRWNGHGKEPEFTNYIVEKGTRVRVVMASRFGDVGLTTNLDAENGYDCRIQCAPWPEENLQAEKVLTDIVISPELGGKV